jgi:hypothetical protein
MINFLRRLKLGDLVLLNNILLYNLPFFNSRCLVVNCDGGNAWGGGIVLGLKLLL